MNLEAMAEAAKRRLREYINRAAGQHKRALRKKGK